MSKKYLTVKKYFDGGFWSAQMVRNAVEKKWITAEEFKAIIGEAYE